MAAVQTTTSGPVIVDDLIKKFSESVGFVGKKLQELTGFQTAVDEEKIASTLQLGVTTLQQNYEKLYNFFESNKKSFSEDAKKKLQPLFQQMDNVIKHLKAFEVQKYSQKLLVDYHATVTKVTNLNEEILKTFAATVPQTITNAFTELLGNAVNSVENLKGKGFQLLEDAEKAIPTLKPSSKK